LTSIKNTKPVEPEQFAEYNVIDLNENQLGRVSIENKGRISIFSPLLKPIKKIKAISIHDGVAYIRIDLPVKITSSDKDGNSPDTQFGYKPYFVTSNHELLYANDISLKKQFQIPIITTGSAMRWAYDDILDYCKNNSETNLIYLYQNTENLLRQYIDFPEDGYYAVCALWIIGTYVSKLFTYYPYLEFLGSAGSAKSKMLSIFEKVTYNGKMSNKISGPSIYRDIESSGTTLLLDETEDLKNPKIESSQILVNILKGAFKTDGKIMVSISTKNGWSPHEFEAGTCIALGHINEMDSVLQERTIQINFLKTLNKTIGNTEISDDQYEQNVTNLRNNYYRLFLNYHSEIIEQQKHPYQNDKYSNRELNQIWKPITTLAMFFEKNGVTDLLKKVETIMELNHNKSIVSRESSNTDVQILNYIVQYYAENKILPIGDSKDTKNWYKQSDIVNHLKDEDDFGWLTNKNIKSPLLRLNLTIIKKSKGMAVYLDREILIGLCKRYEVDYDVLMIQSNLSSLSSLSSSQEQKIDAQNDDNDANDAKTGMIGE
jgi:hypothetical protein